jgi:hypothetical protein
MNHFRHFSVHHTVRALRGVFSLVFLLSLILTSLHPVILYLPCQGEAVIVTLDVCHTGPSAISGGVEMPSLHEFHGEPGKPGFAGFSAGTTDTFNQFIFASLKERPPRS